MFIRRLPRFEYHAPTSLQEALDHLSQYGDNGKVFAGGTDLLVAMKKKETIAEHLINLKGIKELKGIYYDETRGLKIGGLVTLGELERSKVVKEKFSILWDAVNLMAAPQIRNLGTIGGNLCSAVPAADTAPPLIALGASVKLEGSNGGRTVLVENFFEGPGESVLKPYEILTEVLIPDLSENSGGAHFKLMRRNALDLALVSVAVYMRLDAEKRACQEVRIALGAVAPTPIRASRAEEILINKEIDENLGAEAGRVACQEARPISDIRASEEYRTAMVEVLTKRAIMEAWKKIKENS
jgi:carbon-monoxide dehydrogenase medium subunit